MRNLISCSIALTFGLVFTSAPAGAYQLVTSTIGSAASTQSSDTYVLSSTGGQPTIGRVAGPSYQAEHGFWYAAAGSPITVSVGDGPTGPTVGEGPSFSVSSIAPNPFPASTAIRFELSDPTAVQFDVLNASGQRVSILSQGTLSAGSHTVEWDGRSDAGHRVASGVYFLRMRTPDMSRTAKLLLRR